MKGKLIVIEGLDGSGKATQTELLCRRLSENGVDNEHITFPDYKSDSSALVRMYLGGQFGDKPDSVNPYAAACFFACDRFASFRTKWQQPYENGAVIVSDRYTTSNAVHQCSKLAENEWDGYLDWLFDFEYDHVGIPVPDAVIYLRVDVNVGQKLMDKRYDGDSGKKDIHEKDVEYLGRSRLSADYCAKRCGWTVVEWVKDGAMRSPQDISDEIYQIIRKIL